MHSTLITTIYDKITDYNMFYQGRTCYQVLVLTIHIYTAQSETLSSILLYLHISLSRNALHLTLLHGVRHTKTKLFKIISDVVLYTNS
jgi:hypothetical protein